MLVLEDDVVFLEGATWVLRRSLEELARHDWSVLYLGGALGRRFPPAAGCRYLDVPTGLTTTHALAYNKRIYDRILEELPADMAGMEQWIGRHLAIDQYFAAELGEGVFVVSPVVASQENMVSGEEPDLRDQFPMEPTITPPVVHPVS